MCTPDVIILLKTSTRSSGFSVPCQYLFKTATLPVLVQMYVHFFCSVNVNVALWLQLIMFCSTDHATTGANRSKASSFHRSSGAT